MTWLPTWKPDANSPDSPSFLFNWNLKFIFISNSLHSSFSSLLCLSLATSPTSEALQHRRVKLCNTGATALQPRRPATRRAQNLSPSSHQTRDSLLSISGVFSTDLCSQVSEIISLSLSLSIYIYIYKYALICFWEPSFPQLYQISSPFSSWFGFENPLFRWARTMIPKVLTKKYVYI